MVDSETCLIALFVEVDTFCKVQAPQPAVWRGRPPLVFVSDIVALAIFGRWTEFPSKRGFVR